MNLLDLVAAAVEVAGVKAKAEAKPTKRSKYEDLRGKPKRDLWKDSLAGKVIFHTFKFKDGKLVGTDQQVDTYTKKDEETDKVYRYVVVKRLESWVNGDGVKVTKLRKYNIRLQRANESNPDFLEGTCRDMMSTDQSGRRTFSGCVNRVTWEYLANDKVEISYQRREPPGEMLSTESGFMVVCFSAYRNLATQQLVVSHLKLNDAMKESREYLFFPTRDALADWEEWYKRGEISAYQSWDVLPYEVIPLDNTHDWQRVMAEREQYFINEFVAEEDAEAAEAMADILKML